MKVFLSSIVLFVAALDSVDSGRIIPSLAKAAIETTKRERKLRKAEQGRVGKLVSKVKKSSVRKASIFRRKLDGNNNNNGQNDANMWYGDWDGYSYDDEQELGFDITDYSFHYTGCAAIKTYSDTLAEDEDSDTVLKAMRMATFRLCPTDSCVDNSHDGCSSNYGEYVVSMDQFLLGMVTLQEDRVAAYCEYCSECANVEAVKNFYSEIEYHRQAVLDTYESNYESWLSNYQSYKSQGYKYSNTDDANNNGETDYAFIFYQKLMGGNYANKWMYGNGYSQNKYSSSNQYQNGQQQYQNYYNNQNSGNGNGYSFNYNYNQYNKNSYNGNNKNSNSNSNNDYDYDFTYNYGQDYSNSGSSSSSSNSNSNSNAYGSYYSNGKYGYQQQDGSSNGNSYGQYSDGSGSNSYGKYLYKDQTWQMWNSFNTNQFYNSYNSDSSNGYSNGNSGSSNNYNFNAMSGWSQLGAWYGNKIVNGYMEWDGNEYKFTQEWGFIGADGQFHSLEDDSSLTEWDSDVYGFDLPDGWSDLLADADNLQSCSYDSAGSCYNQFFSCMQVLGMQDDYSDMIDEWNEEVYEELYEDAEQAKERATIADYLECTQVDFDYDSWKNSQDAQNGNYNYNQNGNNDDGNNNNNNNNNNNGDGDGDDAAAAAAYQSYMSQYAEYFDGDGNIAFYVGPHCDGEKITLGVYDDKYCSNYVPNVGIEDLIGYNPIDEDDFEFVPTDCVSCNFDDINNEDKWYEEEQIEGYEEGVNPFCSILYEVSGKCNKKLKPATLYSNSYYYQKYGGEMTDDWLEMYQSENQFLNEDAVCAYIDSLKYNTYDEEGEVILNPSIAWWNPNDWQKEVRIQSRAMGRGLKAGVILTGLAAAAMGVMACVLHGMLARKNIPFRSRLNKYGDDPTALARQNSGILMGRSRSGPGTSPLI